MIQQGRLFFNNPKKYGILYILFMCGVALVMFSLPQYAYAVKDNLLGMGAGYFIPADEKHKDIYSNNIFTSVFYERFIGERFSIGLSSGYMNEKGKACTSSGRESDASATMLIVPTSISWKFHFEVEPEVLVFVGCGGDYWYYKETTGNKIYDAEEYGVGGYHANLGVKLFTCEESFYGRMGFIAEAVYSKIDRFGKNSIDFGGLTISASFFISF
ncbi:MAG: hypothetical protein V1753_08275 [Pseudomonadota bacterium]